MSNEEFIEWFKKYTALTKKDNELAETVGLELNVEISVEMAEQLISLIEKQQKEIENKYSRQEILERVKKLERFKEDLKVVDVILFIKREFLEE